MKGIVFLAGFLLPVLSYAQQNDSAQSTLVTTPPRFGGITISGSFTPVKSDGKTFTMSQPVVDAGIPIYKRFTGAHPIFVRTGIRYQGLFFSNEQKIGASSFQSLTVPLLASYSLSRSKNITFVGLVSVGSDFKQTIRSEDLQYTAGIRFGFGQNKSFKYGVTVTYLNNYTGSYILPLPDFDWAISSRWNLSAVLPSRLSLKYKISSSQYIGISGGLGGGIYRLNDPVKPQYLQVQQTHGGLMYERSLGQRWKFTVLAAQTFNQRIETFDLSQKVKFGKITDLNKRVPNISYRQNSLMFQAAISWAF